MADVRYIITVDTTGATASIKQFEGQVSNLGKTTQEKATPSIARLTTAIAAGLVAYQAASRALSGLTRFVADTVEAAIEAEEAENNLRLAIETTGREVAGNLVHYTKYAESLMKITRFDDEAIKSTQALLLQLTNLDQKGIDEATRGAIGLATVFKVDLDTAARIVAKAMEGNVEMLGRYIPKVRDAKTEADKLAIAKEELAKMFTRAEGAMGTTGALLGELKKYYNELKEAVGKAVTENERFKLMLQLVIEVMKGFLDPAAKTSIAFKLIASTIEASARIITKFFGPAMMFLAADMAKARWEAEHTAPAMRALEKPIGDVGKAIHNTRTALVKLDITDVVKGWRNWRYVMDALALSISGQVLPRIKELGYFAWEVSKNAVANFRDLEYKGISAVQRLAAGWSATMDSIKEKWDVVHQGMNEIFQQAQTNRLIAIENEYKTRLKWINANVKDEDERQKMVMALEAEYEIKKTEAKRAAAKQAKMIAIMDAIVNTAEAVTKALAQGGFLLGIPWAAIVAAMGAAQIALIARQPIPLAEGAIFKKRTKLLSESGQAYEVGEGGEPEVLAPLSKIRALAGGGGNVYIELHNYIGDEKIEQRVYKIVNRGGQLGKIRIPAKAVAG